MTLDELNSLDLKTLADWPLHTKIAALTLLFIAIVAGGWWFDWRGGMETLDAAQKKEEELRSRLGLVQPELGHPDLLHVPQLLELVLVAVRDDRAVLPVREGLLLDLHPHP